MTSEVYSYKRPRKRQLDKWLSQTGRYFFFLGSQVLETVRFSRFSLTQSLLQSLFLPHPRPLIRVFLVTHRHLVTPCFCCPVYEEIRCLKTPQMYPPWPIWTRNTKLLYFDPVHPLSTSLRIKSNILLPKGYRSRESHLDQRTVIGGDPFPVKGELSLCPTKERHGYSLGVSLRVPILLPTLLSYP